MASHTFWLKKVYVAGAWKEREAIRARIDELCKIDGVVVTHDWTRVEGSGADARTDEENAACASADIEGVRTADLVIADLTLEDYAYQGTSVEMGVALGCRIPIWTIRDPAVPFRSVFYHADGVTHKASWAEVLEDIKRK